MDICETTIYKSGAFDRHPWEIARARAVHSLLSDVISKGDDTTILDLGCGDVFVASFLSNKFPNSAFHCVDTAFNDEIIEQYNKSIKGQPIYLYPSIDEYEDKTLDKINVVLLLDVIEHIENEIEFLKELSLSKKITSETIFIITVPAFQSLFSNHDIYLKHFRRYDIKTLKERLARGNITVEKTGYFFFSLFIIRWLQKRVQKEYDLNKEKGVGAYKSKGLLDVLLENILYIDFKVGKLLRKIGFTLPGLSCFAICRKSQ